MDDEKLLVLLVDDSRTITEFLVRALDGFGYRHVQAGDGASAIMMYEQYKPDLVLLDVVLPDMQGYDVARALRANGAAQWVPIIFLTSRTSEEDLVKGIEAGGDDYLTKPVSLAVLKAKLHAMQRIVAMRLRLMELTRELSAANQQLARLSQEDGLTRIANRRMFDLILTREFDRARRENAPLALLLIDIDHFKRLNDSLGHQAGDDCLRRLAEVLRTTFKRGTDLVARYGGEEFAVVMPNTPLTGARLMAETFRLTLLNAALHHPDSPLGGHITVSGGLVCGVPQRGHSPEALVRSADEALYSAKADGRNRIITSKVLA